MSQEQAAAATRMKVDHIQALESDDFSRFAAPVYAQGFIKLYANFLGLDPAPLLKEYRRLVTPSRVSIAEVAATLQRAAAQAEPEPTGDARTASPLPSEALPRAEPSSTSEASNLATKTRFPAWWVAAGGAAVLLVLAVVYLLQVVRPARPLEESAPPPVQETHGPPTPAAHGPEAPPLLELPPDPFWLDPLPTPPHSTSSPPAP